MVEAIGRTNQTFDAIRAKRYAGRRRMNSEPKYLVELLKRRPNAERVPGHSLNLTKDEYCPQLMAIVTLETEERIHIDTALPNERGAKTDC
jgi:hypothetical protein